MNKVSRPEQLLWRSIHPPMKPVAIECGNEKSPGELAFTRTSFFVVPNEAVA
jgi:hypothetical protein